MHLVKLPFRPDYSQSSPNQKLKRTCQPSATASSVYFFNF